MEQAPRQIPITLPEADVQECVSRLLHLMRIAADTARLVAYHAEPDMAQTLRNLAAQIDEMVAAHHPS